MRCLGLADGAREWRGAAAGLSCISENLYRVCATSSSYCIVRILHFLHGSLFLFTGPLTALPEALHDETYGTILSTYTTTFITTQTLTTYLLHSCPTYTTSTTQPCNGFVTSTSPVAACILVETITVPATGYADSCYPAVTPTRTMTGNCTTTCYRGCRIAFSTVTATSTC